MKTHDSQHVCVAKPLGVWVLAEGIAAHSSVTDYSSIAFQHRRARRASNVVCRALRDGSEGCSAVTMAVSMGCELTPVWATAWLKHQPGVTHPQRPTRTLYGTCSAIPGTPAGWLVDETGSVLEGSMQAHATGTDRSQPAIVSSSHLTLQPGERQDTFAELHLFSTSTIAGPATCPNTLAPSAT